MRWHAWLQGRPVTAGILLFALCLSGLHSLHRLPISPLPQVDFPVIQVSAQLPGASARTMANAVAAPLERQLAAISDVQEIYSSSSLKSTVITIMFSLNRDIDGAARDVQAAINAAKPDLPSGLDGDPTYRKLNPAEIPVAIYALTSATASRTTLYRYAQDTLQPTLSRIDGVGDVTIAGGASPAIRVETDETALTRTHLQIETVRNAIQQANVAQAIGTLQVGIARLPLEIDDTLETAAQYRQLPLHPGASSQIRLGDIATVQDGVQDRRNYAIADGKAAVLLLVYKKPSGNIVRTVTAVREAMDSIQAHSEKGVEVSMVLNRATTIEASLSHTGVTLIIAACLVIAVILLFLHDFRQACVAGLAIPVSILGTCSAMSVLGYSINNLSLLALIVATGIIVDDAIVVIENIVRRTRLDGSDAEIVGAAAGEVTFSVISMTLSLIAVFSPLIFIQGFVGQLLREFSVTLSVAVVISMVFALVFVPIISACFAGNGAAPALALTKKLDAVPVSHALYVALLKKLLVHRWLALVIVIALSAGAVLIAVFAPKRVFPLEDTGGVLGTMTVGQNLSFSEVQKQLAGVVAKIGHSQAVDHVVGFIGGNNPSDTGTIFVMLKSRGERNQSATGFINEISEKLHSPKVKVFLGAVQDLLVTARQETAQIQMNLQASTLAQARQEGRRVTTALQQDTLLKNVTSDIKTSSTTLVAEVSRPLAALYGSSMMGIDTSIYDRFGQRAFSVVYGDSTPRRIVIEQGGEQPFPPARQLQSVALSEDHGAVVPLSSMATLRMTQGELTVNHNARLPSVAISFDPGTGVSMSAAIASSKRDVANLDLPRGVRAQFGGSAALFLSITERMPYLFLGALFAVYVTLGVLYESLTHPLTVLATIPPAMMGALLATWAFGYELSVDTIIALLLLLGIVKKNAILIVDFALNAQRQQGLSATEAIIQAAVTRARPVLMTTVAAIAGAMPLILSGGYGEEMRRPLGVAIIGGLVACQIVTMLTTPLLFVLFDHLRERVLAYWRSQRMRYPSS